MEMNHIDLMAIRDLVKKAQISTENAIENIVLAKQELNRALEEAEDLFLRKEQERV